MLPHQRNKVDISVSYSSSHPTPPLILPNSATPLRHTSKPHAQADGISNSPQSLTAEEQKLFRLYGKLPSKKDILKNKLKVPYPPTSQPTATLQASNAVQF
jgi:hypothetical protein